MLISMAANKLIVGTFSIRETPMFDTITASLSPHLKTHPKPFALPSPIIPTKNFNTKKLCLSSGRISTLNFNTEQLCLSSSTPLLLSGSCDHRLWAVRTSSNGDDGFIPALLERPAYAPKQERVYYNDYEEEEEEDEKEEEEEEEDKSGNLSYLLNYVKDSNKEDEEEEEEEEEEELGSLSYLLNYVKDSDKKDEKKISKYNNWEFQILRETQPLIRISKMIIHSSKYRSGDRLSAVHEKIILEKLLPYHPEMEEKVGPGVDFISVDNHTDFRNSRCLFLTRKDGTSVDFSFWKCLKGLVWKKYPLYAEIFIQKHLSPRHS